jgi:glycosyltransferase involved in cell wall biosynthesis
LEELLGEGDRVDVITTLPNRYQSFSEAAPEQEVFSKGSILRIPLPSHRSGMADQSRAFAKFAAATLHALRGRSYDLVFATSSRLFTAFLGALASKRLSAPLYLDVRDIFTDTIKDVLSKKAAPILPVLRWIERFTVRSARRVNLVSGGFEDYFRRLHPYQSYSFFTNGIDEDFLGFDFRKTSSEGKAIALYAGNIGEGQGLEKILPKGAKDLAADCEFWVVGDGGRRPVLEAALRSEGVENVRLIPPVDRPRLLELYRESDYLFLHLNDYPAFQKVLPSKIFEYAATGKPILAGVSGYSAEFLREHVSACAVFDPCDSPGLAAGVRQLAPIHVPRPDFIARFRRIAIMRDMVADFLAIAR